MTTTIRLMVLVGLVAATGCRSSRPFSKGDVERAQKVVGLSFTDDEIEAMENNLERNLRSYLELREHPLDNAVAPVLWFEPRPLGFQMPEGPDRVEVELPAHVERPADDADLAFMTVAELGALIRQGDITSVELTEFYLDRMRTFDPHLKAVVTLTDERALTQAGELDRELAEGHWRGPLHGIPYGAKDLLAVPGYPTTWGAAPFKDQVREETATVVAKLDEAGAVLVAKLTSGELASGDRWFGGRTMTPWDSTTGASGSSAGPGAAVAAGLVPFGIGTETWGSIVSPSSRNGLTGLRPTYGQVSRYGVMTLSWSLDKIGPMCRSARDCVLAYDAMRGQDNKDPSTVETPLVVPTPNWSEVRLGYVKQAFESDTTEAGDNARAALEVFRDMGMQVDSVAWPSDVNWSGVISTVIRAESGAVFDELLHKNQDDLLTRDGSRANSLRQSRFIPAAEYVQANRHRAVLIQQMDSLMNAFDMIVAPSGSGGSITNLTGHPVVAFPSGFRSREGRDARLPTSLSLVGRLYDEGTIMAAAMAFQERTEHHNKHPERFMGGGTR